MNTISHIGHLLGSHLKNSIKLGVDDGMRPFWVVMKLELNGRRVLCVGVQNHCACVEGGREGGREGGKEGGRKGGERGRVGGGEEGREEGGREGGRRGREGGGGSEGEKEGGREEREE